MKNKNWLMLLTTSLIAGAVYSQTATRVGKALNDPMRKQNEAKADVYIQSKQAIRTSTNDTSIRTQTVIKKKERVRHIHKKSRR